MKSYMVERDMQIVSVNTESEILDIVMMECSQMLQFYIRLA